MYLTEGFKPANVGDEKNVFFLRYNIYEDQMEFVKEEKVYYLKKDKNSKILFRTLNKTYKCFDLNGDLEYFNVVVESSKIGLASKEKVQFTEAKKARTNYDDDKPADYRRLNDEYYFIKDNMVIKMPKKKKDFLSFFKKNESDVKKHMKSEKLSHKDLDDLKKIVLFNNSLK